MRLICIFGFFFGFYDTNTTIKIIRTSNIDAICLLLMRFITSGGDLLLVLNEKRWINDSVLLNVDETDIVLGDDEPGDDVFEFICFVGVLAVESLVDDFLCVFADDSGELFWVELLFMLFELLPLITFRGNGFGFIMSTKEEN